MDSIFLIGTEWAFLSPRESTVHHLWLAWPAPVEVDTLPWVLKRLGWLRLPALSDSNFLFLQLVSGWSLSCAGTCTTQLLYFFPPHLWIFVFHVFHFGLVEISLACLSFTVNSVPVEFILWRLSTMLVGRLRIDDFRCQVIHGASEVLTRTRFTGMSRSRPACITSLKMFNMSSEDSSDDKSLGQSKPPRYLHNSALRLARLSRFRTNFVVQRLLSLTFGSAVTVSWSDRPKDGVLCPKAMLVY